MLSLPSSTRRWYSWSFTVKFSSIRPKHLAPIDRIILGRSCWRVWIRVIMGFGAGALGFSGLLCPFWGISCCWIICGGRGLRRSGGKGKRYERNWGFGFRNSAILGKVFPFCIPPPRVKTFSSGPPKNDCSTSLAWTAMIAFASSYYC